MRVDLGSKTIVVEKLGCDVSCREIDGLGHATCGEDAEKAIEVRMVFDDGFIERVV